MTLCKTDQSWSSFCQQKEIWNQLIARDFYVATLVNTFEQYQELNHMFDFYTKKICDRLKITYNTQIRLLLIHLCAVYFGIVYGVRTTFDLEQSENNFFDKLYNAGIEQDLLLQVSLKLILSKMYKNFTVIVDPRLKK